METRNQKIKELIYKNFENFLDSESIHKIWEFLSKRINEKEDNLYWAVYYLKIKEDKIKILRWENRIVINTEYNVNIEKTIDDIYIRIQKGE